MWDPVLKKMIIGKDVVFEDHIILMQSVARDMAASKREYFKNEVIKVDINP